MSKKKSITLLIFTVIIMAVWGALTFVSFKIPTYTLGGKTYVNNYNSVISSIELGIDLNGGVYVVLEPDKDKIAELEKEGQEVNIKDGIAGAMKILRTRLDSKGYTEATIQTQGDDQIRIEIPEVDDPEAVFDIIGQTAQLEFRDADGNVILDGKNVKKAYVTLTEDSEYCVGLEFDSVGKQAFADATKNASSSSPVTIGIFVDDNEITSPQAKEAITNGRATITSPDFAQNYEAAYDLAMQINSGALEIPLKTVEPRVISSVLGEEALQAGLLAGAIGLVIILVYMAIVYGGLGIVADIALVVYVLAVLFFLAVLPFIQLTLAGIAGVILGIGMAVDANVVIFERIKDEYKAGKEFSIAMGIGFKKATVAVLDANVTTLIAAAVLWIFGNGTVQGFAMSLVVSIVLSFISAVLLTRLFMNMVNGLAKSPEKFYRLSAKKEEEINA
ncbi:MAG: protein translocase subunit SecD [Clostridia bacterium]|nr:protein translocase subunit SecD [Clostridia bacterium]